MTKLAYWLLTLSACATALAAPEPEKKTGQAAAGHPAKPGDKGKEDIPTALGFTYDAPDKKSFADFTGATLRSPQQTSYIGLQYGTGKTEVVYVCFDPQTAQDVPDRAHVFFAGSSNPPIAIRGRSVQAPPQKNVKIAKIKSERFELPPLRSRIGKAEYLFNIQIVCGHQARANVHLTADVAMKTDKTAGFILHASLGNTCVPVPNEVKVLPLLAAPVLHINPNEKVIPPWIRPYVAIGEHFLLEPGKGMDLAFAIELKLKETGKVVDKGKSPVKIPEYSALGEAGAGTNFELKGAKAGLYEASASIDLGPLGYPSVFIPLNIPVAEKKKAK